MNASPFWPLVWKEYRTSRAFWLAMAVMGLVAQAGVAWLAHQPADRNWWLYGIALMISAGFAVGIGGTLFAVEHEDRTFALLRILPVRAKELGLAKVLCAVAGLSLLLVALWLAAGALAGWQALSAHDAGRLWGLWGLACAEGLAWGILCSLAIRSPLLATVTALLAVTLSIQAAVALTTKHNLADIASYSEAIPFRLVLLLIVGGLDAWLLPRWLAGRVPHVIARRPRAKSDRRKKAEAAWISPAPSWSLPLGHLMWQAWREVIGSAWLLVGGAVVSLPLVLLAMAIGFGALPGKQWLEPQLVEGMRVFPWFTLVPFISLTGLAGSLVFRSDAISGARFLAERGVSSRLVWLARQMVWGGWLCPLLLVATGLAILPELMDTPVFFRSLQLDEDQAGWVSLGNNRSVQSAIFRFSSHEVALNAFLVWDILFSAFAVSQLVSLVVKRRLLAAVFSIVAATLMAGWAYLMFAINIPGWWSVLPLGAGCLLATWFRTPDWLLARTDWRGWILPAAAVVVPVGMLAIAVPSFRVEEIPAVELHWTAGETSPAAAAQVKAALALYERADDALQGIRQEWTDADLQATADLVIEASRYRSTWLAENPRASLRAALPIYHLGIWLSSRADACRQRGQFDKALDASLAALRVADHFDECAGLNQLGGQNVSIRARALDGLRSWAAAPGLTTEQLREATGRLDESHVTEAAGEARLRSWYYAAKFAIEDFPAGVSQGDKQQYFSTSCWITSRLPWERHRALRLESIITSAELDRIRTIEHLFSKPAPVGERLAPMFQHAPWDWSQFYASGCPVAGAVQWLRTTPLVMDQGLWREFAPWSLVADETDMRATKITLALEAWRAEHGKLPDTLEQLVPSELEAVPLDPVWAQQFLYYPQGVAETPDDRLLLSTSAELPAAEQELKEFQETQRPSRVIDWLMIVRRPFLWSALSPVPGLQPVVVESRHYGSQIVATYYDVERHKKRWWRRPVPDTSVLQAGRAYVIAQSEEQHP